MYMDTVKFIDRDGDSLHVTRSDGGFVVTVKLLEGGKHSMFLSAADTEKLIAFFGSERQKLYTCPTCKTVFSEYMMCNHCHDTPTGPM